MSVSAVPSGAVKEPQKAFEPRVLGESRYDRVTSFLMAVVLGAFLVVGWLGLVFASNQEYTSRVTSPLHIIEVFGGGGGSPDGTPGSTEKVDVAGADAAPQASNNEESPGDFEQPSIQTTPGAMLDAALDAGQQVAEMDIGPAMPNGGAVASGRRASKIGTGGPGLGFGPGDGGVSRENRWSVIFPDGQRPEEYARQLDALGVELAVVAGKDQLTYVTNFSAANPTKRTGVSRAENRLYFIWEGRLRKSSDLALLRKAGIEVGEGTVFQFYPPGVEDQLADLERRYRGRTPGEIRVTRFGVIPNGDSYAFKVLAQETLR
ncbi:MAG: hypothetical protein P4L85_15920 [Paludisphaera borealis]|uniref:hypothetical protein n=1 Tax=Paludisphaera borealis TaxID=1387353 RepID=UPI0028447C90|nr:hypothetical protein [Paludisphaera borealis]MDR3620839.1 hypothetical protein [Paludisphaera borealis]